MTAQLAEKLAPYGIDYVDAMDRFGDNADLFKRLALKYLSDERFVNLVAAMEVGDFEEGYAQAHALKGVAGNLSMIELYNAATVVSNALHDGEYQSAEYNMPAVEKAHKRVLEGLEKWATEAL